MRAAAIAGDPIPQAGPAALRRHFQAVPNYVALPPSEAFRIEYWELEEAKIRRQPPEKELSRQIALVVGRQRDRARGCPAGCERGRMWWLPTAIRRGRRRGRGDEDACVGRKQLLGEHRYS